MQFKCIHNDRQRKECKSYNTQIAEYRQAFSYNTQISALFKECKSYNTQMVSFFNML